RIKPKLVFQNNCPNRKPLKYSSSINPATIVPAIKFSISICWLNLKKDNPPKNIGNVNRILVHTAVKMFAESPKLLIIEVLLSIRNVPKKIGIPTIRSEERRVGKECRSRRTETR